MLRAALVVVVSMLAGIASAAEPRAAVVADPYLELRTGPGWAYPVFYVAERGEAIEIVRRRTDWFEVRLPRGVEGWVALGQITQTLTADGDPTEVPGLSFGDYAGRRWEVGVLYGDFGGANAISTYGALSFTRNLSAELWLSQALGRFSNSTVASINLVHLLYPDWRASPYFTLGAGSVRTEPKATLVAVVDREDSLAHVGVGVRTYLTRRFVFRAEYKSYVAFTSRDDNEEILEWKAGFSFFF
jgi:uncharacterized protein YgiM (DUF1202 family)